MPLSPRELEALRWIIFDNQKVNGFLGPFRFLKNWAPKPDPAAMDFLKGRVMNALGIVRSGDRAFDEREIVRSLDHGAGGLDEVGDLPLDVQPKLLRFLQEGEIQPLGEQRVGASRDMISRLLKDLVAGGG